MGKGIFIAQSVTVSMTEYFKLILLEYSRFMMLC